MTGGRRPATGNAELADQARQAADRCAADRRAYLCLSVVLTTTTSITAARKALADIGVGAVRDRAEELLGNLEARQ